MTTCTIACRDRLTPSLSTDHWAASTAFYRFLPVFCALNHIRAQQHSHLSHSKPVIRFLFAVRALGRPSPHWRLVADQGQHRSRS